VDARAELALAEAVRRALAHELDEIARIGEAIDRLFERVEAVEGLAVRVGRIERRLSPRPSAMQEAEIVRLYKLGLSTRAIAQVLATSRDTVIRRTRDLPRPARSNGLDGKERRAPRPRATSSAHSMT
jgi:DNA-binding NarL/FixJ family response regulator